MISIKLCLLPYLGLLLSVVALSYGQNATFNFLCARSEGLCNTGSCNMITQNCECPADGKTYNYECLTDADSGYCVPENVYGPNCDIQRVGVYCVAGKMFLNVLPHGGNAKFDGDVYLKDKQGVAGCGFVEATSSQPFEDKAVEYSIQNAANMEGLYFEITNTDATCGNAEEETVAATADEPAHTLYKREFYIQYNKNFQASFDQFVTATCKEVTDAEQTKVYSGIGDVSDSSDTSNYEQVNVQSEVGFVSLELLDKNQAAITGPIPLGTEVVLKFNLGSGNEYSSIWLSGCKANNSLEGSNTDFKEIDLIDANGCPATGAAGVFRNLPSKPAVAAGEPQVILMSIGAFRFTGSSSQVSFECTVNLCKAGDEANCNEPAECAGYKSDGLDLVSTDNTTTAPTPGLAVILTSNTQNPLGLNEAVTLTCTGSGGTAPLEYSIREQSDQTAPTFTTGATLSLPTGTAGTKSYVCEVKDADGNTKISEPVALVYADTLTVGISQSPEGDITVNTNVAISCKAAGGTGPYTYVIQRDGTEIAQESTVTETSATAGTQVYKCVVTDTGANNVNADSPELTVNFVAATVATEPLSATLTSGTLNPVDLNENVVLTCSATGGDSTYTYEIFRGAEATAVSTTATYTATLTEATTQTFKCKVTDGTQATADSNEVSVTSVDTLTVGISRTPEGDITVNINVAISCKAAGGTGPYTYVIQRDGTEIAQESTVTETSATAGTQVYKCVVTDTGANNVNAGSSDLSVNFVAAAVATEPLSATLTSGTLNPVDLNENVVLTCSATGGDSTYTYEIFRGAEATAVSTTATYTATLTEATTQTFKCKVTDGTQATADSNEVSVTSVDTLTVGISRTPEGDITVNTNVAINCKAAGGTGPYTYVIQRDGTEIAQESTVTETSATAGTQVYKCVVTDTGANNVNADSSDLSVNFVAAAVATEPLSATLTSGTLNPVDLNENVVLTCSATGGDSTYTYEIFRGAEATAVSTTATYTATLTEATTQTFKCKVTDGTQATADSNEVSVTSVGTLTVGISQSPEGDITINTNVAISCKAAGGNGPYTYVIQKGGTEIAQESTVTDTSATAGPQTYKCVVTDTGANNANAVSSDLIVNYVGVARRRRSVNIRYKRDTEDIDRVSATVSVYDPNAVQEGQVQIVKDTDCVHKSDVTVVVIILSIFLFLLLVIATILGLVLLRSRRKVAGLGYKANEFEYPTQTMAMPRLEINSSGYGSSVGSHGV